MTLLNLLFQLNTYQWPIGVQWYLNITNSSSSAEPPNYLSPDVRKYNKDIS